MSCVPPPRRRSLRARLVLLYTTVFAVALGIVFVLFAGLTYRFALQELDDLLLAETRQLLDLAGRRKARIMQAEIDRLLRHHNPGGIAVLLDTAQGFVLARSEPEDVARALGAVQVAREERLTPATVRGPRGEKLRVLRLQDAEGTRVAVGLALEDLDRGLRTSAWILLAAYAASILLATALAWMLAGRAFGRIEEIRRAAERLAGGDLTRRLPETDEGDEVAALSRTFNGMIGRIAHSIAELKEITVNMAHDYRTPLTRMRAAAELALVPGIGEKQEESLAFVMEECDRLSRMSANLLQIARLDAGADRLAREAVPLHDLVSQAVDLLGPAYTDKGVLLSADGVPPGLCAEGDPTLVERAIANLLDNALKYTPAGGRVHVTGRAGAGFVEVSVADTGIGIPPMEQEKVFQRFYRIAPTATEGSGLGLSFVQAAVQAMGGSVRLESAAGRGSTFIVRLPAHTAPPVTAG